MEQLAVSAVRAGAESVTCREPEPRVKVLTVPDLHARRNESCLACLSLVVVSKSLSAALPALTTSLSPPLVRRLNSQEIATIKLPDLNADK
eukprot:CAMPEP_0198686990 /NCGR_PEP_ID=MMETSP1468-20131203/35194_1 /TAXON_ID=1461545 /ORGANISM="Mantoniella sp, Strain CCMP1436" /LENGTH=90 /DNA_ID=CAMNT_0044433963 /DNA_START=28 /DNA_END=299 /DNA_ORIENTATION=+